eukprot:jgi/Mesvir1/22341/Mv10247-RA.1
MTCRARHPKWGQGLLCMLCFLCIIVACAARKRRNYFTEVGNASFCDAWEDVVFAWDGSESTRRQDTPAQGPGCEETVGRERRRGSISEHGGGTGSTVVSAPFILYNNYTPVSLFSILPDIDSLWEQFKSAQRARSPSRPAGQGTFSGPANLRGKTSSESGPVSSAGSHCLPPDHPCDPVDAGRDIKINDVGAADGVGDSDKISNSGTPNAAAAPAYDEVGCGRMLMLHNAVASWLAQPAVASITLLTSHPRVCAALREWSWADNLMRRPAVHTMQVDGDSDNPRHEHGKSPPMSGDQGFSRRVQPLGKSSPRRARNLECTPPMSDVWGSAGADGGHSTRTCAGDGPSSCIRVSTREGGWESRHVCDGPATGSDDDSELRAAFNPRGRGAAQRTTASSSEDEGNQSASRNERDQARPSLAGRLRCVPMTNPGCYRPSVVSGVPTIQCVFTYGAATADPSSPVLMMLNADIVLPEDIGPMVTAASGLFPRFLIVGRRVDLVGGFPRHLATYQRFQQGTGVATPASGGGERRGDVDVGNGAGFEGAGQGVEEGDELAAQETAICEWRQGLADNVARPNAFMHSVYAFDYYIYSRSVFCDDAEYTDVAGIHVNTSGHDQAASEAGGQVSASGSVSVRASVSMGGGGATLEAGGVNAPSPNCRHPLWVLPFLVGRMRWDDWLFFAMTSRPNVVSIDATTAMTVFHLNPPGMVSGDSSLRRAGSWFNSDLSSGRRGITGFEGRALATGPSDWITFNGVRLRGTLSADLFLSRTPPPGMPAQQDANGRIGWKKPPRCPSAGIAKAMKSAAAAPAEGSPWHWLTSRQGGFFDASGESMPHGFATKFNTTGPWASKSVGAFAGNCAAGLNETSSTPYVSCIPSGLVAAASNRTCLMLQFLPNPHGFKLVCRMMYQ